MFRLRVGAAALLVALVGAGLLQGQGAGKGDEKPVKFRGILPAYYKKLGLRDDQIQAIYKIQGTHRAKAEELRRQLKELKDKEREATEKVLTADQLKRLRELRSGERTPPASPRESPPAKAKEAATPDKGKN
jgi:hypothetical protein